jgi:formate hydrogenlyase transcriptional activator
MATAILAHPLPFADPQHELIGDSLSMQQVRDDVHMVARTDSTVLIQGETGTGKEVIARAIHEQSSRSHCAYIKINCAAMPAGLLESELFGHERGAFTGALNQTTGRFQLAHQGTLFLDEIGDLPLELQPKLLRVLQEHEFERLGSSRTIHVNVRVIAATNQDLLQMVKERRFRADLYYRLNVFPITLPPLRDRGDDLSLLVRHFVRKFARRMNREISHIPEEAIAMMKLHNWPGNIRELQNFLERAVILSRGPVLQVPPIDIKDHSKPLTPTAIRTLADAEREHIAGVLRETRGRVGGRNGAAVRLGVARTTLIYRMQKLGIAAGK